MDLQGKRVVIFGGKTGLLGQSLTKALTSTGAKVYPLSSKDCDLLEPVEVEKLLNRRDPDLIINAVAYTAVDLAEDEEEAAFALNATAPQLLAAEAIRRGIPFVHYSTDFVFKGDSETPYTVYDETGAFSVYGISKAEGERNLLALGYEKTLIIRISWLFGPGKINFVEKILSLAEERDTLSVVDDQTGSPSYAPDVATNTVKLLEHDATGIYHLANSGDTTWYGLASAAVALTNIDCDVQPVPSSAYPTKATRPRYSVLDLGRFTQATGETPRHWKEALEEYVKKELKK
ncbi:dTDP-4-dehydrorhamnose reductase [Pseudodesulfovibrio sp. zrk46]|uniref:dTDP-4-dehydrorhamnose reductase n=1 Tax=Pseudodesulfovibrio sp. zrk46 TaxID=2725288 RepID=UPI0014499C4F|nr:dTDP-4-dehydrorhamnose reductase [Pseudodesulfovibrio sp. zrk46]QJB57991.1 dTDP-4-dehydrorhamnose reductase [Pseudodesulfovibrio sp. zrk46]